jgi:drug/metabolite transporter (DMT)-like permease
VFANIFAFVQVAYYASAKHAMSEYKVNPLDICQIRTLIALVIAIMVAKADGASFRVPREMRKMLLFRSLTGTVGFTSITFSVKYCPLIATIIIFNTAPFWASLLAWFCIKEKITRFEAAAMVLSFGGVLMIAFAKPEEVAAGEGIEVTSDPYAEDYSSMGY